ncbi:hypothetical protein HDU96_010405 [Phlyctochytrium bullatum]|nr:hypothetical protein HDU96_010405 [Phlyctochytrium bullatum]
MPLFNDTADCYYSQARDCGLNKIPGFDVYARILASLCWVSTLLGILAIFVSVQLRRVKAMLTAVRQQLNTHPDATTSKHNYSTRPRSLAATLPHTPRLSPILNQFEVFLLIFTLSTILGALSLTLSAWVDLSSKAFYGMIGPRNVLVYIAIMVYVDMVLQANTFRDSFLDRLRTLYLRLLLLPISIVFGLFIYQGILSDEVHYGNPERGIPPNDAATVTLFGRVSFINTVLWLMSFLVLCIFVLIGRRSFSTYLTTVVEPALERETTAAASVSTPTAAKPSSSTGGGRSRPARSATRELASTLRSALWTMKWIATGLAIFLIYSVFYAIVVAYLGSPDPVYWVTLLINFWAPTGFGIVLFAIVLVQRAAQLRAANWDREDLDSDLSSGADATAGGSSLSPTSPTAPLPPQLSLDFQPLYPPSTVTPSPYPNSPSVASPAPLLVAPPAARHVHGARMPSAGQGASMVEGRRWGGVEV